MTIQTQQGAPEFPPPAELPAASSREQMDAAIQQVQAQKDAWPGVSIQERVALLEHLLQAFVTIAPRWVAACAQAKGLTPDAPGISDEWNAGLWPVVRCLHQMRRALLDIARYGHPRIPGPVTTREDGQVVAQVLPGALSDRIFLQGVSAEVWMEPGITREHLSDTQAMTYQHPPKNGKVALVLGAGNVASIGPLDILYKLFVENQVVIFKTNPVNAYLGPLLQESLHALIEPGYLRLVYGGAEEGTYLCQHTGVDEIHITGSDKTFDAIVFGPGVQGAERKATHHPLLTKRVTGELGNVSPVIVVPGPWSTADLAYQADHIVSMLVNNAGFNCNATRVIIQHEGWPLRNPLLRQIERTLAHLPLRPAYYPGAQQRHQAFLAAHPEAEQFGLPDAQALPWTLISGVDPQTADLCFTTEAFCGLFAETELAAENVVDYLARAVAFANERLWGTLSATILVHPRSLKDPHIAVALEQAIAKLRYGTIGINYWAGVGFALTETTWGAFPGHDIYDIQSGTGVVHNTLMFAHPQKSVLRGPFRSVPTPPWFASQARIGRTIFPKLVDFEATPSARKVPGILWTALTGR